MLTIPFINSPSFQESFFANLFADTIVAILIGIIISQYLSNNEKKKAESKQEKFLKEKLHIEVNMLWSEIEYNRNQLKLMLKNLPISNLVYPALETSAWEIIDKSLIIDRLKIKDFANILHIYNRTKTINRMYYSMLDKVNWIEEGKKPIIKKFYIDSLIDRCNELLKYINKVVPEKFTNLQSR